MKKILIFIVSILSTQVASANELERRVDSFTKYVLNVAIPTITFQQPIEMKPYLSMTHHGQSIKVGPNQAYIQVAGISAANTHLTQRLTKLGCFAASAGAAALICESDVIDDEIGKIGVPDPVVDGTPQVTKTLVTKTDGNQCKTISNVCVLSEERKLGSDCGCYDNKGEDVLLGTIQ